MRKVLAIVFISLITVAALTAGQGGRTTIWNGVYSADQAANGEAVFRACQGCHGSTLDGNAGGSNPPLRGERFMEHWREDNMDSLYLFIKGTMPPANARLSESDTLNVISYILQSNGVPAGSSALTVDGLPYIRIEAKEGPRPLPDYALVQVVGCLAKGEANNWLLTSSSEAVRARRPGKPTPQELKAVEEKSLGSSSFRLQNLVIAGLLDPSNMEGHKMYAKGALIRGAEGGDRISITSLDSLSSSCGL